jgi:cytochrome c oxidase assembly protein subunit 15
MPSTQPTSSPWPHRAAVLLVCATWPLLWVGGLVTSLEAGMAVHDWPTTFGYNMFLYPLGEWLAGPRDVFVEHGHRLLASTVGLLTILLVAVTWRCESRAWVRWLSVACLAAVIGQGLLGGLRVIENKQILAFTHGCVGQAFFALSIVMAAATSAWWRAADAQDANGDAHRAAFSKSRLVRVALLTAAVAYWQIIFGAIERHFHRGMIPHLVVAGLLTLHIVFIAYAALRWHRDQPLVMRPALGLVGLVLVQAGLGVAAWVTNHGWPAWLGNYEFAAGYTVSAYSPAQVWSTTAHVATGGWLFGVCVLLAARAWRLDAGLHGKLQDFARLVNSTAEASGQASLAEAAR